MDANEAIRIVRREESLRSVRKEGTHLRLLYENEWLELLTTEVQPGNSIGSNELWDFEAVHFVVEGGLLFHNSGSSILLLPGDSIALGKGKKYRISNATSSRAVIWSLLFKTPKQVFDPEASSRGPQSNEAQTGRAHTRREKRRRWVMTVAQKYIFWAAGILLWIFGLSILLSTITFGYLDLPTVRHMALVLSPLLLLAVILLFLFKRPVDLRAQEERVTHIGQTVTEERT